MHGRTHVNRDGLLSNIWDWERMWAKRKKQFETAGSTSGKPRSIKPKSTTEQSSTNSTNAAPAVPPKTTISAAAGSLTSKSEAKTDVSKECPTFYCFNFRIAVERDTSPEIARNHDDPSSALIVVRISIPEADARKSSPNDPKTRPPPDHAYCVDAVMSAKLKNPFSKTVLVNGCPVSGLIHSG